jgi:hypothetical protein
MCDWCLGSFYTSFLTYLNDYNNNIYSWHTCDYYVFDWNAAECQVNNYEANIYGSNFVNCDWNDYELEGACGWCGTCDSATIISEINSNEPYCGNVGNEGFLS